jgi:outer membrane receptor protein involved in Fe transport
VRATGLESEGDLRLLQSLDLIGSLALTHSRFEDTPGLTGNHVPQVPDWQVTGGVRWTAPRRMLAQLQIRSFGRQFEDDRNTLVLRSATLVDASADGPLARTMRWVAAVENLFNTEYDTGRTPLRTIGTPLTVRIGLRLDFR